MDPKVAKLVTRITESDFKPVNFYTGKRGDDGYVVTLVSKELNGSDDLMAGIGRLAPGQSRLKHHHPTSSELYLVTKGTVVIHIAGEEVEAGYGTSVYIPKNTVHAISNRSDEWAELVFAFNLPERSEHGLIYDEDER